MEKKEKLIIIGDSAFAQIAYEYFTYDSFYEVKAFSVEKNFLKQKKLFDLPVVPFEKLENLYNPGKYKVFVAVTYTQLNRVRTRLYEEVKKKGFSPASYVSSKAFVWRNAKIGENCFIFENNVIQPFTRVGDNVIFWSGNHIGHHSIIKDHCFFSSHVVVSGFCEVGEYCFLGVNATITNNIKIEKDCIIGAGAVILKDTKETKIYKGNPAKSVKNVNSFDFFGVKEEKL